MSRITRCPGCTVMFKVVEDQLKVAEGWVRCGECGEVFDAAQHVVGADGAPVNSPSPWPAESLSGPAISQPAASALVPKTESLVPSAHMYHGDDGVDGVAVPRQRPVEQPQATPETTSEVNGQNRLLTPQPIVAASAPQDNKGAQIPLPANGNSVPDPAEFPGVAGFYAILANSVPADATLDPLDRLDPLDPVAEPSFVREAERRVFWKHPPMQIGLAVALGLLLLILIIQWLAHEKNTLAAREPRLAPLMAALCQPFGCAIHPLRQIEAVVVDSASFVKTDSTGYQLAFVLKNRSGVELEVPAVEVTLTDRQDQPLVRRVVLPPQFGVNLAAIGARSELSAGMLLKLANEPASPMQVAGYRIVAFYP